MNGSRPEKCPEPRWAEDFPIQWERDHYITRRELAKFLTLGSLLLAGVNAILAAGLRRRPPAGGRVRIGSLADVPPGGSLLFRYPTAEDPCILIRGKDGAFRAYSQVCTHLSCAVVYRKEADTLFCPCHAGYFSPADGRPTGGPPTRPLPRIRIEQAGDGLYAVGRDP